MVLLFSPASVQAKIIHLSTLLSTKVSKRECGERDGLPDYKSTTGRSTLAVRIVLRNHYKQSSLFATYSKHGYVQQ